jgi:amino acid permease
MCRNFCCGVSGLCLAVRAVWIIAFFKAFMCASFGGQDDGTRESSVCVCVSLFVRGSFLGYVCVKWWRSVGHERCDSWPCSRAMH